MSKLLRLAATVEFSLVLAQEAFHPAALPLGGAHPVQIALCLGLAFIGGELHALIGELGWHSTKRSARKYTDRRNTPPIVNFDLVDIKSEYLGVERRVVRERRIPDTGGRRMADFRRAFTPADCANWMSAGPGSCVGRADPGRSGHRDSASREHPASELETAEGS